MTTDELSEKLLDFAARMNNKRFKVIACNVMWRELSHFAALSPHAFNLQFLDWGLHAEPDRLRQELQKAIDATGEGYDAILLGYGLCSNGVEQFHAEELAQSGRLPVGTEGVRPRGPAAVGD